MACVEVTGELCFTQPVKPPVVFAKQILNNTHPDTYPYEVPVPVWGPSGDPGSPWVLPVFTGWAYKGSWVGPSVGDNSTRWSFEYVEFTAATPNKLDITLKFANEADIVYRLPNLGFSPVGPHRIYTPNDTLLSIVVEANNLSSYPGDQSYF